MLRPYSVQTRAVMLEADREGAPHPTPVVVTLNGPRSGAIPSCFGQGRCSRVREGRGYRGWGHVCGRQPREDLSLSGRQLTQLGMPIPEVGRKCLVLVPAGAFVPGVLAGALTACTGCFGLLYTGCFGRGVSAHRVRAGRHAVCQTLIAIPTRMTLVLRAMLVAQGGIARGRRKSCLPSAPANPAWRMGP